jgi:hypothetical protein
MNQILNIFNNTIGPTTNFVGVTGNNCRESEQQQFKNKNGSTYLRK